MIETEKSGGPMHPQQFLVRGIGGDQQIIVVGASLLDMYAAAVLPAVLTVTAGTVTTAGAYELVARRAFDIAVAMVDERRRRLPQPVPAGAQ
jgi:hypothetical protein